MRCCSIGTPCLLLFSCRAKPRPGSVGARIQCLVNRPISMSSKISDRRPTQQIFGGLVSTSALYLVYLLRDISFLVDKFHIDIDIEPRSPRGTSAPPLWGLISKAPPPAGGIHGGWDPAADEEFLLGRRVWRLHMCP
ncbi:hypothetical protein QBC47DRAFT_376170 [Echria macrotheca]|uniref:Uncharacterized protein n=1 Tax=Echria macrotheca TaxID=438768 RepID=A0AAJ0BGH9_9PEZI|nr:hypothetical protein QBC47DRAFT_376170 [Echria macrotheca]